MSFISNAIRTNILMILVLFLIPIFLFLANPHALAITTVPDPPTGLSAIPISPTTVSLHWSKPLNNGNSSITVYRIESKLATGTYNTFQTNNNVTGYNSTGLTVGKTYIFRVSAVNAIGPSIPSSEVSATPTSNSKPPQSIPPNPPTGLVATSNSATQINLSWNPPVSNAGFPVSGYKIQFSIDSGNFTNLVSNSASTSTSYSHTGLSSHTYSYKVFAINSAGTSNSSNIVSAVPNQVISAPYTPSGLVATAASPTSISLSWIAPSSDGGSPITGYKIEAKIAAGAYTVIVSNTGSSLTTYLNKGLITGSTYTYRVSAINSIGASSPSNEGYATPTKTFVPTGVSAIAVSPTEVDMSWVAPSETYGQLISGYRIDKELAGGIFDSIVDNTGMTTSYPIKDLQTGKTYSFTVIALFNGGTESQPSVKVSVTPTSTSKPPVISPPTTTTPSTPTPPATTPTPQPENAPSQPTGLNVTKASTSGAKLSWVAPSNSGKPPVSGYKIEIRVGSGPYSTVTTTANATTSYLHTGLITNTYTYRVSAINSAGTGNPSNEASVTFTNTIPPPPVIESSGGIVPVANTTYFINHNIVGGKVLGMAVNPDTFSLQIRLQSKTGGSLSLNLARELIDAKKLDGSDDIYLITAGKQLLQFNETKSSNSRMLVIGFPAGTSEISIYGTHVVPEFPFALLALFVALFSAILFSRKLIKSQSSL